MALWKFTNKNKYGTLRSRIMYKPDGQAFSHGPGFGSFVNVQMFRYEYKHEVLPPHLVVFGDKKVYCTYMARGRSKHHYKRYYVDKTKTNN